MLKSVTDYLEQTVKKYSSKVAFADSEGNITFGELRKRALVVAGYINSYNIVNKPIAIKMRRRVDCIVAFLGVAYSGCFYCPIDNNMPTNRIIKIFEKLNPALVITELGEEDEIKKVSIVNVIAYDDIKGYAIDADELGRLRNSLIDTDPLYVLFTSGSTGMPKGVIINHRSVIDYSEWVTEKFKVDEDWVFGNQAPFYFDNSVLDIYQTIKNGCTCYIIPEINFTFPADMMKYLKQHGVNTVFWVPSVLCNLANSGIVGKDKCYSLKRILFCGEVMPNKQLNVWRKWYPDVIYANLYGPTEITDVCSAYIVDREFDDNEPLPIGNACENTNIMILDDNNVPVKRGEKGELCVRGTCLFMGYYNDPDKTKEVLVQNPLNKCYEEKIYRTGDIGHYNDRGELIYDGRMDYQIKHRGYRVELGEIETATYSLDNIESCCALYDDDKKEIALIVKGMIEKNRVARELEKLLPRYMLPSQIICLEYMPYNANGKIDRKKLSELLSIKMVGK